MSTLSVSTITDASGGNTASINSYTPTESNMAGRNRIINGSMVLDQRNAGASVTAVNGAYTVDRWLCTVSQSSKFTAQQNVGAVTPPAGFINYLGCTSSSAYSVISTDYLGINQRIEGLNMTDFGWGAAGAATVTLSFWVRSSLTGTFGGSIMNSGFNRSYPFSYTISAANTWEQKSVTIAGDTSGTWLTTNGVGARVFFSLGCGSTRLGTAGSWTGSSDIFSAIGETSVVGTSGATFYITGVQLEVGNVATPFERRQYGQELALCQRYYFKELSQTADQAFSSGVLFSSTNAQPIYKYPTTMRSSPTVAIYNCKIQSGSTSSSSTSSLAGTRAGLNTVQMDITVSGFTTGYSLWLKDDGTNTGYVSGSAEL